jgi:hypothetical protein
MGIFTSKMGGLPSKAMHHEGSFIRLVKNAPAYRQAGICGVPVGAIHELPLL